MQKSAEGAADGARHVGLRDEQGRTHVHHTQSASFRTTVRPPPFTGADACKINRTSGRHPMKNDTQAFDAAHADAGADAGAMAPTEGQAKAQGAAKSLGLDITSDEDLGVGIMNLISLEEHLFFTANKTGKDDYYDLLLEIREIRKELLKKIVVSFEGEVWCISKHLLATSMRLMEVGTKELKINGAQEAKPYFEKSYRLFRMFWEIVFRQPGRDAKGQANPALTKKELVVFFKPDCPHCKKLEDYLLENHADDLFNITKRDVTSDPAIRAEMEKAHSLCFKTREEIVVPMVTQGGTCAMGEVDALRFVKSLMWDHAKETHRSEASLVKQADASAEIEHHVDVHDKTVDAALNCCKE
jgi:glutaredoxin